MSRRIVIQAGNVRAEAELNDSDTANAIADKLPIEAYANRWGDEVYFSIGIELPQADDAREEMAIGELGYWPIGTALCIFFGPTPMSRADGIPRAATDVNPVGRLVGDPMVFSGVRNGDQILLLPPS